MNYLLVVAVLVLTELFVSGKRVPSYRRHAHRGYHWHRETYYTYLRTFTNKAVVFYNYWIGKSTGSRLQVKQKKHSSRMRTDRAITSSHEADCGQNDTRSVKKLPSLPLGRDAKWTARYRPKIKLRKGNVFTPVCQSFCSQGGLPQCMLEYTPPPGRRLLQRTVRILLEYILVISGCSL